MENEKTTKISVIIPVYNEEKVIGQVVADLKKEISGLGIDYEIIVVNDGCLDGCRIILSNILGVTLINHPYNKGYGASLKTGAQNAKYEWLLFFDGDGQHKVEHIKDLIGYVDEYDMVAGAREGYKGPWIRQPGKRLLHLVANYLVEQKIPDVNCGFRLVKKDCFLRYEHILPNGFSLSTTTTLAFIKDGLNVKYVPITIDKRSGRKSSVKISDGFRTLLLITRLIMLFSPLKIFLPVAVIGFIVSLGWIGHDLIYTHFSSISKFSGFLFVSSLLVFLFGLLADQVAAIRRRLG